MFDINHKKCVACNFKRALFNSPNEEKPLFCLSCKLENMLDVKNRKCIICNLKQPYFNYEDEKQALSCKSCKLDDMIHEN